MIGRIAGLLGLMLVLMAPGAARADPRCDVLATGGSVSLIQVDGLDHCVHRFSAAGSSSFTLLRDTDVTHLIVGGGGGAGTGRGGGGGVVFGTVSRSADTYTVTVGAGGASTTGQFVRGETGASSAIFDLTALGGGGGGNSGAESGLPGGSGGGAGRVYGGASGGAGSQGGNGAGSPSLISAGGGGGGAGGNASGPDGGNGVSSTLIGSTERYAGGGASMGVLLNGSNGAGQSGPGGGGQYTNYTSTAGRTGVVILRYRLTVPPQADAGPDQSVSAFTDVALDGTGSSHPNNDPLTYSWTQTSGTTITLGGATTAQPTFRAPQPANGSSETLAFQLTVTDPAGLSATDTVSITVSALSNQPPPQGAGGSVSEFNDISGHRTWRSHVFFGSSTLNLSVATDLEYLIVGGGGGGGAAAGGGGGAGGVLTGTALDVSGTQTITIGEGGAGGQGGWSNETGILSGQSHGSNGGDSSAFGVTALGGGGGGTFFLSGDLPGRDGGSGGGGSHNLSPGSGTAGQGNNGASGTLGCADSSGGGGGGQAGSAGTVSLAGKGGDGITSDISGLSQVYAGGGAGGGDDRDLYCNVAPSPGVAPNVGGAGGGGGSTTANGIDGTNGLGGGGGGAMLRNVTTFGGQGGSGVVVARYVINTGPAANAGPDADAFPDQPVTLSAALSTDPDDNIASYSWTQTQGTAVALTGADTATPSFDAVLPAGGATAEPLVFDVTVTDDFGLVSTDSVTVTLRALADLTTAKTVMAFSEDGRDCDDLTAAPDSPDGPTPATIPGACIEYTITVTNSGPVPAEGIILVDDLPDTLILRAAALEESAWSSGTTLDFTAGCTGCTVEVRNGSIPAGQSATVTIRVTIR